jgi:hypothetical protein
MGNMYTRRKKEIKEEKQGKCDKQQKQNGRNK